jgi:hypothetical protein
MEWAAISPDLVGDVLAQLGLVRFHPPGIAFEKIAVISPTTWPSAAMMVHP